MSPIFLGYMVPENKNDPLALGINQISDVFYY